MTISCSHEQLVHGHSAGIVMEGYVVYKMLVIIITAKCTRGLELNHLN